MRKQLLLGTIAIVIIGQASPASAAPAVDISQLPFGGNGILQNGGMPGEAQFGSYTVVNTGTTPLTITNMALTGGGAFAYSDSVCGTGTTCPQTITLAPGAGTFVSVTCTAPQPGQFTATLIVTSNAASGTSTAILTCRGFHTPVIQTVPAALDFGTQHVCWQGDSCGPACATQPATQTLTITNAAADPSELDLAAALPADGQFESFTITSPQQNPYVLRAGESVVVTMTYHPAPPATVEFDGPIALTPSYPPGLASVGVPLHAHGGTGQFQLDSPTVIGIGPLGQPLTTSITGHSVGDSCIDLDEAGFESSFTVLSPQIDPQHPRLLQAGESLTWQVSCTPSLTSDTCDFFDLNWRHDDPETGLQATYCCEAPGGALVTDPLELAFVLGDAVAIGTSATQQVRVSNTGNQPTDLVALTSSDPHITAEPATGSLPITLAPGAATFVDVTFTPTDTTRVVASILFDGSNGDNATLTVSGDGVLATAGVTPSSYDFGAIALPASPSQTFQLANLGQVTLTILAATLDLPNDYAVVGLAAGATIDPGATLSFSVRATPSTLGARHASLAIDLDRGPDLAIPLDAIATDPALVVTTVDETPTDYALELGSVDVDVGPRTGHLTLHNAGSTAITFATCALAGEPAFSIVTACPLTIAAGADVDLAVAFAPTMEAELRGTLLVTGTGFATGGLRVALHGTGIDQHIALSAMSLSFPDTFRHPTTAPTEVVTVHNTAATALVLSQITIDGAAFTLVGPATATLAPDASADITIAFSPAMIGDFTGHLVLGNADDPQIARVDLVGRGVAHNLAVSPLAVDLGDIKLGTSVRLGDLQPDAITIHNADAVATTLRVVLTGDPAFHLLGADSITVGPGASAKLDLSFAPTATGAATAQIAIFADDDAAPAAQISVAANVVPASAGGGGGGCSTSESGSLPLGASLALALIALRRRPRRRARASATVVLRALGPAALYPYRPHRTAQVDSSRPRPTTQHRSWRYTRRMSLRCRLRALTRHLVHAERAVSLHGYAK